jgi:hypothetical protein
MNYDLLRRIKKDLTGLENLSGLDHLSRQGEIARTHFDDKGQRGTFAFLDVITPRFFPSRSLHSHSTAHSPL